MKKLMYSMIIAGAFLIGTVPCMAAEPLVRTAQSDNTGNSDSGAVASSKVEEDYKTLPSLETVKKEVGFAPKLTDTLKGDFKFKGGSNVSISDVEKDGKQGAVQKSLYFRYEKTNGKTIQKISMVIDTTPKVTAEKESEVTKYNQIDIIYNNWEDSKGVSWNENNINYGLMNFDKTVSKEELIAMAKQIIDIKADTVKK